MILQEDVRAMLIGRRIVEVNTEENTLRLDDGTVLQVVPNDGGCLCNMGCFSITHLGHFDNAITDVKTVYEHDNDEEYGIARLFVFADTDIGREVVTAEGADNGYYGYGFDIEVVIEKKEGKKVSE